MVWVSALEAIGRPSRVYKVWLGKRGVAACRSVSGQTDDHGEQSHALMLNTQHVQRAHAI
jgi:hypothetical protein